MGLFDELRCKYTLPIPEAQELLFQSKDTPAQHLDLYEIREDGTLWHEAYDVRVEESDESPLGFWLHRDNKRWIQVADQGELEIHVSDGGRYYSFRLWFRDGIVCDIAGSGEAVPVTTPG